MNWRIGHHGEVRAVEDGAEVSVSSRLAVPVHDVEIPPADALLVLAVEVVSALVSDAHRGIEKGGRQRTGVSRGRLPHGTVGAPVCPIAALRCLAALEERKKILVAPAGGARRRPLVIVTGVATDEGHSIYAAGPAQNFAPWVAARETTGRWLLDGRVPPVDLAADQRGPGRRDRRGRASACLPGIRRR